MTREHHDGDSRPRHPSAGNLGRGPSLVRQQEAAAAWPPASYPQGAEEGPALALGPDLDPDLSARLIGSLENKRVLELGCGSGRLAMALARQGARVIAVDPSREHVEDARAAADAAGVKVELHHGDLADLPFVRGDQVDLCISVYALAAVDDLGRVFRQVERVLRSEAAIVCSLPHPLSLIASIDQGEQGPRLRRTHFDDAPLTWTAEDESGAVFPHRISDVFTALWRSNLAVEALIEPRPLRSPEPSPHWTPLAEWVPTTVVFRARKLGV